MDRLKTQYISNHVKRKWTWLSQLKVRLSGRKKSRLGYLEETFNTKGYKKIESQRMGKKSCAQTNQKKHCNVLVSESSSKEGFIIRDVVLILDKRFISDMII